MKILGIGNMNRMGEIYCKIFRDLGYDADFLIWHEGCRKEEELEPIKIKGINKNILLFSFILKNRKKYDLFICHYALQSAIICNFLKLNYVCHVRGYDITHSPNNKFYGNYLKKSFINSKAIWCSTNALVRYAKQYHDKVNFIPNIIRTNIYKPIKMKKIERLSIFMPSRQMFDNKGIDVALKLFKEIQNKTDAELHFIDWGKDKEKIKEFISRFKVKNVFWHPLTQDQNEMNVLYNSFDVVWDSFGYTKNRLNLIALEAMSCNKPVISMGLEDVGFPNPPVVLCKDEEEVIDKTINFQKVNSRDWIINNYGYDSVKNKIKEYLEEVVL